MARPHKLLVCEDDLVLRYSLHHLLEKEGYEVSDAESGREALAKVRAEHPDLVLLDVRLPDQSGREVCRQIKSDPALARTLVIHLSGVETAPEVQAVALESGADGYLTKPINERTLLAHVRALLRLHGAERALVNQQESELRSLGERSPSTAAPPSVEHAALVRSYCEILDRAVEERSFKVEGRTSSALRSLAQTLASQRAGPREVLDLHLAGLQSKLKEVPLAMTQAYVEEGRLSVLELMGYLAAEYRSRATA